MPVGSRGPQPTSPQRGWLHGPPGTGAPFLNSSRVEDTVVPRGEVVFFHSLAGVGGWPGVLRVGFLRRSEALRSVLCPTKGQAHAAGLTRTPYLLLKKHSGS